MRKIFLFVFLLLFAAGSFAQSPIVWTATSTKTGEGIYTLNFKATIAGDWKLYGPGQDIEGLASSELQFSDSSILIQKPLASDVELKSAPVALFGNKPFLLGICIAM